MQVCFAVSLRGPLRGNLRGMKFTNKAITREQTPNGSECEGNKAQSGQSWLTFGFLYDIMEQSWFPLCRGGTKIIQFDYSFEDRDSQDSALINVDHMNVLQRTALPKTRTGGSRCLFVSYVSSGSLCGNSSRMTNHKRKRMEEPGIREKKVHVSRNEFKSKGLLVKLEDMKWDYEIPFPPE